MWIYIFKSDRILNTSQKYDESTSWFDSTLGQMILFHTGHFRLTIFRTASSIKDVFASRTRQENTDTCETYNTELVGILLVQMQRRTKAIKNLRGLYLVNWDDRVKNSESPCAGYPVCFAVIDQLCHLPSEFNLGKHGARLPV